MKLSASARRSQRRRIARNNARRKILNVPITLEEASDFFSRLIQVDYGTGEGCWLYPAMSVGGGSKTYARKKFHGLWVMAHRFALAFKMNCTLWDLEDYDAAHSSKAVCLGGRCCNPDHLAKKLSDPNRSWDRAKDAKLFGNDNRFRTAKEIRAMMLAMYPTGLPCNEPLFDEPWDQNVSPMLRQFLELGIRRDFKNMQEQRENTAQQER